MMPSVAAPAARARGVVMLGEAAITAAELPQHMAGTYHIRRVWEHGRLVWLAPSA